MEHQRRPARLCPLQPLEEFEPAGRRLRQQAAQRRSLLPGSLHYRPCRAGRHLLPESDHGARPSARLHALVLSAHARATWEFFPARRSACLRISTRSPALDGVDGVTTVPGIAAGFNTISTGFLAARDNSYSIVPTLTMVRGRHTLKFGAELRRQDVNYFQNNNPSGAFSFDTGFTSQNPSNQGSSGAAFASFLLGYPNNSTTVQTSPFTAGSIRYQGYFANDTFQVYAKLTLNARHTLGDSRRLHGTLRPPGHLRPESAESGTAGPHDQRPTRQGRVRSGQHARTSGARVAAGALQTVCAARRRRIPAQQQDGHPHRRRHLLHPRDRAVPRRAVRQRGQLPQPRDGGHHQQQRDAAEHAERSVSRAASWRLRDAIRSSRRCCWAGTTAPLALRRLRVHRAVELLRAASARVGSGAWRLPTPVFAACTCRRAASSSMRSRSSISRWARL